MFSVAFQHFSRQSHRPSRSLILQGACWETRYHYKDSNGTPDPKERTFMIHLPSSTPWTKERTNPGLDTPDPTPTSLNISKTRPCILVVEDDRSVAGLLENVLRDWGYHVCMGQNGREGLGVVANHAIDGILLDMHMPVMDGRTMLDELRWLGYQMPVLVFNCTN